MLWSMVFFISEEQKVVGQAKGLAHYDQKLGGPPPVDWSLAEVPSFHKIWFKSVNNFLRYPARKQTDRQTGRQTQTQTDIITLPSLTEVITWYIV